MKFKQSLHVAQLTWKRVEGQSTTLWGFGRCKGEAGAFVGGYPTIARYPQTFAGGQGNGE
jgi:hypothetical protein